MGVSSRINEWLTKTPDGNKSPAPKPSVSSFVFFLISLISQLQKKKKVKQLSVHLSQKDGLQLFDLTPEQSKKIGIQREQSGKLNPRILGKMEPNHFFFTLRVAVS